MTKTGIIGVVLAGGQALRMDGLDKAGLIVGGQTCLAHVVGRVSAQCDALVVSGGDADAAAGHGLPCIADSIGDSAGPLAGLLAAMDWTRRHAPGARAVLSVPADGPFVPHDLVARLEHARNRAGVPIACAASGGRRHPVFALWSVDLVDILRNAMTQHGVRKVGLFADHNNAVAVEWPVTPVDPFFNINTPADLVRANLLFAEIVRS